MEHGTEVPASCVSESSHVGRGEEGRGACQRVREGVY